MQGADWLTGWSGWLLILAGNALAGAVGVELDCGCGGCFAFRGDEAGGRGAALGRSAPVIALVGVTFSERCCFLGRGSGEVSVAGSAVSAGRLFLPGPALDCFHCSSSAVFVSSRRFFSAPSRLLQSCSSAVVISDGLGFGLPLSTSSFCAAKPTHCSAGMVRC